MSNTQNEMTLGQLFTVVKKSWKKALIYVLVSVIIATTVLALIRTATNKKYYTTTITFSTTDKNTLSTLNANKANIVNNAISDSGNSLNISEDIIKNTTITAVYPDNLDKENAVEFIPTSFDISLTPSSNLKFNSKEYISMLDYMANGFVNLFALSPLSSTSLSFDTQTRIDNQIEYFQIADDLSETVNDVYITLSSYFNKFPSLTSFRSSDGKTFNDITNNLKTVINRIDSLKFDIVSNKIENGDLKSYLEYKKSRADAEQAAYEASLTTITEQMGKLSEAISQINYKETGIIVNTDFSAYSSLLTLMDSTRQQKENASQKAKLYEEFLTKYNESTFDDEKTNYVKTQLVDLSNTVKQSLTEYNTISSEFNTNRYLASSAHLNTSAHSSTDSILSIKIIALADFAIALVAYLCAFVQTNKNLYSNDEKDN